MDILQNITKTETLFRLNIYSSVLIIAYISIYVLPKIASHRLAFTSIIHLISIFNRKTAWSFENLLSIYRSIKTSALIR